MPRNLFTPWLFPVAVALACGLGGCGSASGATSSADLVQTRCTRCHSTVRIDGAKHDRAGWQATVDRMRGKGARLTDDEAVTVVEYLATR